MRILPILLSALLMYGIAAPTADAEGKGKGKRKGKRAKHAFKHFDKNGDGQLTADEVPEKIWAKISKADADGDGIVTKAELKAARKARKGRKGRKGGKKDGSGGTSGGGTGS